MGIIIISVRFLHNGDTAVFNGDDITFRTHEVKRYNSVKDAKKDLSELKKRMRREYARDYSYDIAICEGEWNENGELVRGYPVAR